MKMRRAVPALLVSVALAFATGTARAEELVGAGGTAIYPVLSKWAAAYEKQTGVKINYQAIGSGGGIAQIKANTVQFANSDKPLTPSELSAAGLVQFPAVVISITPVVNLPGVKPGELVLDGKTLAGIYLGKITDWDAPEIRKLNPDLKLPHTKITTVHRSDGSGTTFNFTNYLSKVSPAWKEQVGDDVSLSWPTGIGGKGNAGVAQYVHQISGAIGYVEYAYVIGNRLVYTRMVNRAGQTLAPTMATFEAAAANADFTKVKDFYPVLTNQSGDESWPIIAATYMLMRKDASVASTTAVLKFMDWALKHGQAQAEALAYVPLPDSVVNQIEKSWSAEFKGANGKQVWTAGTQR